jgi:hypothetical protein
MLLSVLCIQPSPHSQFVLPFPAQVLDALRLSRATLGKIRGNLAWAFAYNLVALPLAAGALLPGAGLAPTPSVSGMPRLGRAGAALAAVHPRPPRWLPLPRLPWGLRRRAALPCGCRALAWR